MRSIVFELVKKYKSDLEAFKEKIKEVREFEYNTEIMEQVSDELDKIYPGPNPPTVHIKYNFCKTIIIEYILRGVENYEKYRKMLMGFIPLKEDDEEMMKGISELKQSKEELIKVVHIFLERLSYLIKQRFRCDPAAGDIHGNALQVMMGIEYIPDYIEKLPN